MHRPAAAGVARQRQQRIQHRLRFAQYDLLHFFAGKRLHCDEGGSRDPERGDGQKCHRNDDFGEAEAGARGYHRRTLPNDETVRPPRAFPDTSVIVRLIMRPSPYASYLSTTGSADASGNRSTL